MKTVIIFLVSFFVANICFGQTKNGDDGKLSARKSGTNIILEYENTDYSQAHVEAFVSLDGGESFEKLSFVSGSVGDYISKGQKTITWDVLKWTDGEDFNYEKIMFKVSVCAQSHGAMYASHDFTSAVKPFHISKSQ